MKTPRFWYDRPGLLSFVLSPLSLLYGIGAAAKRCAAAPYKAKVPVICIGGIVAGGSGKTPTALEIARLLIEQRHKPVFVTRGYGGSEEGPLKVDAACHTSADVGDEALLLARAAPVWVGRDRAAAIREAEKEATHIILDDGFQNTSVRPDISLLTIDSEAGIGNGMLLPAGPLRETFCGAMHRATAVVLIGGRDPHRLASRVECPLLCAKYEPRLPDGFPREAKFFAFAGIARPEKFYQTCRDSGLRLAATRDFADHHAFNAAELAMLAQDAQNFGARLLTTEKDWVRLPPDFRAQVMVLPVTLAFEDSGKVKQLLSSLN